MCLAVHKACPHLFSGQGIGGRSLLGDTLPRFLHCDMYALVCRQNKLRPKMFDANTTTCQAPLVTTKNDRNWVKGIARCAFPCRSPAYRLEHYALARNLAFAAAITGIFVNVCVLVGFFGVFLSFHRLSFLNFFSSAPCGCFTPPCLPPPPRVDLIADCPTPRSLTSTSPSSSAASASFCLISPRLAMELLAAPMEVCEWVNRKLSKPKLRFISSPRLANFFLSLPEWSPQRCAWSASC